MKQYSILSFNIRVDVPTDGINAWPNRKKNVISFIKERNDDIVGIQEAGPHMYQGLKEELNNYQAFGLGRDSKGESTPVFVKKGIKVIESNTIWLTNTPYVESTIKGSNHPRISTYVVIETEQDKKIAFFNTHLDYTGDETTLVQTKHLLTFVKEIEEKYQAIIIICGDFNSYPGTKTIQFLENSYQSCYPEKHHEQLTFHGFSDLKEGEPIDYIFFSRTILMNSFEIIFHHHQTPYLSDHYPIAINVSI
jgi:endonuclease/exonuclease/phosphatase family metal-dependent hydrolase